ncbi:hypothetical protein KZJ38_29580 [Paraburkholderia edwinii]|uniref:Uncharacterized protein n=1 Tax=Paraburkholderia edwinii TaxID=2861782 RepID=A0ABX8UW96_9BURK|nr:hypothetical protein [Paraburkholderia edwinii]QYD71200.1 hypothetical protein KZJ38_29580 [Paraburkholderia edwinii]
MIDERWLDDASCVALLLLLPPLLDMLEVKKEASGFVARWLFFASANPLVSLSFLEGALFIFVRPCCSA